MFSSDRTVLAERSWEVGYSLKVHKPLEPWPAPDLFESFRVPVEPPSSWPRSEVQIEWLGLRVRGSALRLSSLSPIRTVKLTRLLRSRTPQTRKL